MLTAKIIFVLLLDLSALQFAFAAKSNDPAVGATTMTMSKTASSRVPSMTRLSSLSPSSPASSIVAADIRCGDSSVPGTVRIFNDKLDDFCRRDFSIDQDALWTSGDVQYRMSFRASRRGYCSADQCSRAYKDGLSKCRAALNRIDKSGAVNFDCGEFQWLMSPAPPLPKTACQSPDHPVDKAPFTRDQALEGLKHFKRSCSSTFMKEANTNVSTYAGCVLHYNPCALSASAEKSVDIVYNITQTTWKEPNAYELSKLEIQTQFDIIVEGCDTNTTSRKWGGFTSHGDGNGDRLYTITGVSNRARVYPKKTNTIFVDSIEHVADEEGRCKAWM